jgi:hypothetical protein
MCANLNVSAKKYFEHKKYFKHKKYLSNLNFLTFFLKIFASAALNLYFFFLEFYSKIDFFRQSATRWIESAMEELVLLPLENFQVPRNSIRSSPSKMAAFPKPRKCHMFLIEEAVYRLQNPKLYYGIRLQDLLDLYNFLPLFLQILIFM